MSIYACDCSSNGYYSQHFASVWARVSRLDRTYYHCRDLPSTTSVFSFRMASLELNIEFLCSIIPVFIYMMIFIPTVAFASWQYLKWMNHIVIQKRYGIITLHEVFFGVIEITLRSITIAIGYFYPNPLSNVILECIDALFVSFVIICWNERFWHLFYG